MRPTRTVLHVGSVSPGSSNRLALQLGYTDGSWHAEVINVAAVARDVSSEDRETAVIRTLPHWPGFRADDPVILRRLRSLLRRVVNAAALYRSLIASRADLLHAHEHSSLWPAAFWAVLLRRPAIWDPHDYFHESVRRGARFGRFNVKEFLERWLVSRSVPVLVVSEGMRRLYADMYPGIRAQLIMSYSADNRGSVEPRSAAALSARRNGLGKNRIRILYPGLINANRIPLPIVEAIGRAEHVEFDIYGIDKTGSYLPAIEAVIERFGFDNIHYRGPYTPANILSILCEYHFALFAFRVARKNIDICLPNKFFQCIEAALPIIATDMQDLGRLIRDHGLGATFAVDEPEALTALLNDVGLRGQRYTELVANVLAYRSNQIDYESQRSDLLDAYESALHSGARA